MFHLFHIRVKQHTLIASLSLYKKKSHAELVSTSHKQWRLLLM